MKAKDDEEKGKEESEGEGIGKEVEEGKEKFERRLRQKTAR